MFSDSKSHTLQFTSRTSPNQNTIASGTKKPVSGEKRIRELFVKVFPTFRKSRPAGFSFDKRPGWSDWEYTELWVLVFLLRLTTLASVPSDSSLPLPLPEPYYKLSVYYKTLGKQRDTCCNCLIDLGDRFCDLTPKPPIFPHFQPPIKPCAFL